jgi:hypothetical protein
VTASRPKGFTSVMTPSARAAGCATPPWATRALGEPVLFASDGPYPMPLSAWEPAAGEGHMAEVLAEYFQQVHASDVSNCGCGYEVGWPLWPQDRPTPPPALAVRLFMPIHKRHNFLGRLVALEIGDVHRLPMPRSACASPAGDSSGFVWIHSVHRQGRRTVVS